MVAACSHEGGLLIDVTPTDSSVDQVRLYIGTGDATSHQTLGLPLGMIIANQAMRTPVPDVTYWARDPGNELDTKMVGPGETVRFVLVHADTDNIPALLAVGYSNGKIVQVATKFDVQIPTRHFALFTLDLQAPVGDLTGSSMFAGGAWDPDSQTTVPYAACAGVFERGARYPRSMIVSPDDQDCDGFINGGDAECTPDIYRGSRTANLAEVGCLVPDPTSLSCVLGGPSCIDNTQRVPGACQPTGYCAPYSVCEGCSTDLGCAKDVSKLPLSGRPATYTCAVHTMGTTVCENDIVLDNLPSAGLSCADVAIADKTHKFSNKLSVGGLEIKVGVDAGCHVTLKPGGDAPTTNQFELGSMVAVTFQNGRGLAVPVVLELDSPGSAAGCSDGGAVHCAPDATLPKTELTKCVTTGGTGPTPAGLPVGAVNPTLTGDMLDIWFTTPPTHIWHASRTDESAAWSPPTEDPMLEIGGSLVAVGTPHVSRNGLMMYLSADRGTGSDFDIYRTTRSSRTTSWTLPLLVQGLQSSNAEGGFATDSADQVGVFHRRDNAVTNFTIRTAISSAGLWGGVVTAVGLQGQGNLLNPVLSDNGLTIYYANDATGAFDLFTATRANLTASFSTPQLVPGVSSPANDVDPWVAPDGHTIYFASDRMNGGFQIYMAHL
jgi:hypothetical protein